VSRKGSPLALLFATVFIHLVAFGIVIPVLPLYAERFGASPLTIGWLVSIYSVMQCLFAPILGRLSDRVGRKPVLLISILGTSAGFLLMGMAGGLPLLFVGRILDGVTGGNISTAQAYIADVTSPRDRSRGMGIIGAGFGLGFIFGPAIGGLFGHFSLAAPFYFAAGLSAVNAALVWWMLPESLPAGRRGRVHSEVSLGSILRQARGTGLSTAIATYFFTTVAFSLLTATYPLFSERRFGYHAREIGLIFAGVGVIGVVVQGALMGRLETRFGEAGLTVCGAVLMTVCFFGLPLGQTAAALLAATALIGLGHSLVTAPLNALASRSVGAAVQGRVLGVMQSAASLARIAGPVLGGWLLNLDRARSVEQYGRAPYAAGGVILVLGTALAFRLLAASGGLRSHGS